MALFQEIDLAAFSGGQITGIEPGSVADDIGLQPGDALLAINDQRVIDVIDVQFHAADEVLDLLIRRDGELIIFEAEREYNQSLGLEFSHPTFDTDIRRCTNLCEFCFVLQMAPRFRRTLYIKDDDYRYSFLFGHFVTLTNLDDYDWNRIKMMGLSPLYVSVHVTDLQMRRDFLRNQAAPDILKQLRQLADWGIDVHTQLVVVPEFNDGRWLQESVEALAALWPAVQSISVVPVGLTGHHKYKMRVHTAEEAAVTLAYVEALQPRFLARFDVRFVYPSDEWYLVAGRDVPSEEAYDGLALEENGLGQVRHFLTEWQAVQEEIKSALPVEIPYQSATLATGTLFAPVLERETAVLSQLLNLPLAVLPMVNEHLGETITVAGLLMSKDVVRQIKAAGYGDLVLLPRVMFDHPDTISLDDLSPQFVADELGCPVALADTLGDVWDALIGQSKVVYYPTN